ncbi:MAG: hypothetical protein WCG28_03025 [bacterium]
MILTIHALTGATLATLFPDHPVLGFTIGFASHFVLDAIPHSDYSLSSMKKDGKNPMNNDMVINKDFYKDLFKIGVDGVLGFLFSFILLGILHQYSIFIIFLGALGGMIPDALQFCYFKWRHEPLKSLQRFHIWVHSKTNLDDKPIAGALSQIIVEE